MTLCGHRPVTLVLGHRWIPIWRPYGRDRLRVFLQPCQSTAFSLVTRGGPPGSSYSGHVPCLAPASGVFPQFTGNLCAQTLHSSSRRGWRDRSVLSRRPRQPSRAAVAAPLRDPYDLTTPTSSSGCWPYRHTQEASSRIHAWPDQCLARLRVHGRAHKTPRAEFPDPLAVPARSATLTRPRSRSKRASDALAVHEPQQHSLPGHREALGRTPPEAGQHQHGYGPAVLVATHFPAEPASQDHEDSHFPLRIEGTLPRQSL